MSLFESDLLKSLTLSCIKNLPAYPDYSKSSLPAALCGKPGEGIRAGGGVKGKGAHVLVKMAAFIEGLARLLEGANRINSQPTVPRHPDSVF